MNFLEISMKPAERGNFFFEHWIVLESNLVQNSLNYNLNCEIYHFSCDICMQLDLKVFKVVRMLLLLLYEH